MVLQKFLEEVYSDLTKDRPFAENLRLVLGQSIPKEAVKDQYLLWLKINSFEPVIGGRVILSLDELAADFSSLLLGKDFKKILSVEEKVDSLVFLSTQDFVKSAAPKYASLLRDRGFSHKVVTFLNEIDSYYFHEDERSSLIEAFEEWEPIAGSFYSVMGALWSEEKLWPWTAAQYYRDFLKNHEGLKNLNYPKKIFLVLPDRTTPLQKEFLKVLSQYSEIISYQGNFSNSVKELNLWTPHSVWDELSMLETEFQSLKAKGLFSEKHLSQMGVFVPADDLYKRLVLSLFQRLKIPVQDPTLNHGWREDAGALWWRDFFQAIQNGMTLDSILILLGSAESEKELEFKKKITEDALRFGKSRSLRFLKTLVEKYQDPKLSFIYDGALLFSRSMKPERFYENVSRLQSLAAKNKNISGIPTLDPVIAFAENFRTRDYLQSISFRVSQILPLFTEFLSQDYKKKSKRNRDGIWFLSHDMTPPVVLEKAFYVGSYVLPFEKTVPSPMEFEGFIDQGRYTETHKIRKVWERLNSEFDLLKKKEKKYELLFSALLQSKEITISWPSYSLSGHETRKEPTKFFDGLGLVIEAKEDFQGGKSEVGWEKGLSLSLKAPEVVLSPYESPKTLRISAFEDYLKCPFLYYGRHILKTEEYEELSLDPSRKYRGVLVHKVLERVLKRYLEGSEPNVKEIFYECLEESKPQGMFRDASLKNKFSELVLQNILRWWDYEKEQRVKFQELKPWKIEEELSFHILDDLELKGRADRIDKAGNCSVVIDYKTGSASFNGKDLRAGYGAQLLMYAAAVKNKYELDPASVWYLETGKTISNSKGIFFKHAKDLVHSANARNSGLVDGDFDALLDSVLPFWKEKAADLKKGIFTAKPAKVKDCDQCLYQNMCGFPFHLNESDEVIADE